MRDEELEELDLQLGITKGLLTEIGRIQGGRVDLGVIGRLDGRWLVLQGTLLDRPAGPLGTSAALTTFNELDGMRVSIECLNL